MANPFLHRNGDVIELRVAGKSQTKQRPRFDPRSRRAFTAPANVISENDVRSVWREAGEPRIDDDAAIGIDVLVTVCRPKSHFNSKNELNKKGLAMPIPSNKKPDLDNAVKLICDALNTRAYKDDVQVAHMTIERRWGDWPSTLIRIYSL